MPFYKDWGFGLVVIWVVTFFVNWAVFGGDPFGLIGLELGFTLVWLVAWSGRSRFVKRRAGHTRVEGSDQPVHLWPVAGLAVIWYGMAFAAYPYTAYLFYYPPWIDAAWVCGVWVGLAASLLLPARSRYALPAFGVSAAGLMATAVYVRAVWPTSRAQNIIAIQALVVALLLLFYAWRMRRRKVLR